MELEYDEHKRAETLVKRGLDFSRANRLFSEYHFTVEDRRKNYGERRFQTIGLLDGEVIMVVWTPRNRGRRIISMRRTSGETRNEYHRRRLGEP